MILTALRHGSPGRQVTVLAVHVVGSRTRVVAQPDTEVLDLLWFLLVYLKAVHMTLHRRKASQALLGDGGGGTIATKLRNLVLLGPDLMMECQFRQAAKVFTDSSRTQQIWLPQNCSEMINFCTSFWQNCTKHQLSRGMRN